MSINNIGKVKASICLLTYNQEKYIAQSIEGILQQETKFDFDLVIGEDCSTDNTGKICKLYAEKYPNKIKLISNPNNIGLLKNFVNTINNCIGEYIGYCEGDDYWTNTSKLQKQVDILENNPEISLVHTQYTNLLVESNTFEFVGRLDKVYPCEVRCGVDSIIDLLNGDFVWTRPTTFCFRRNQVQKLINDDINLYTSNEYKTFDFQLGAELSFLGKIFMLNEDCIVYRRFTESVSATNNVQKRFDYSLSVYKSAIHLVFKYEISLKKLKPFFSRSLYGLLNYIYILNSYGEGNKLLEINSNLPRVGKLSNRVLLKGLTKLYLFRIIRNLFLIKKFFQMKLNFNKHVKFAKI